MTYNYQIQIQEPGTQRYALYGAMRYREAIETTIREARAIGATQGYIWPQTAIAKRKVNNIPWVTNHRGIDYLSVELHCDPLSHTISGVNIEAEGEKALAIITR